MVGGVNPTVTLRYDVVSTLNGVAPSTICGLALSTLSDVATSSLCRGLLQTMAASFLIAAMCFCLSAAEVGMNFWNAARRLVTVVAILSCSLKAGSVQWDGFNRYVPEILYPLVAGA
jgi:hypothetical protein